ncbi:MAG: putative glycoside hydrolase [Tissierellia bacterium]|nr:putative glycoside hydrolase [Tissierellia bacterium]
MYLKEKKKKRNYIIAVIFFIIIFIFILVALIKNKDFLDKRIDRLDLPFFREDIVSSEGNEYFISQGFKGSLDNVYVCSKDFKVRGIYINSNSLVDEKIFESLIEYSKRNDINSFVIDVKDDFGNIVYKTKSKYAKEIGSDNFLIEDIKPRLMRLEEEGIYPIARIVAFRDPNAKNIPKLSLKAKDGSIWKDFKGNSWLNPYDEKVHDYLISIAKEATLLGFKDIQFDYVRFPSDGKLDNIDYSANIETTKSEAINFFISKARKEVNRLGAVLSVDTFGLITSAANDSGIGQELIGIMSSCDVISPMIYPSHYYGGNFNLRYPNSEPYVVVNESIKDVFSRTEHITDYKDIAKIRPWIQAFSAPWLKRSHGSNYLEYGGPEILAQINGLKDAGVDEFLLWNASSRYVDFN